MSDFLRERNRRLHELALKVQGYMRCEDTAKARETFEQWLKAVKEMGNEPADC